MALEKYTRDPTRTVFLMEETVQTRAQNNRRFYPVYRILQNLLVLLLEACILGILFGICLRPMKISGNSMQPLLNRGDIVLVNRIFRYLKEPERGDLIVFQDENGTFIKRIIGLPGETVEVVDGEVFIDSCPVEEVYASELVGDASPLLVPEGSFYVLGDSRAEMYDSRMDEVGCISVERIQGIVEIRLYPLNRILIFE